MFKMEAFISRKRRKLSEDSSALNRTAQKQASTTPEEDDSTDFKLAMLASMHPYLDQQLLLDTLLAHDGSIEEASAALQPTENISPKKSSATIGYQSSLTHFATPTLSNTTPDLSPRKQKVLSKKGKTLHLYSPEDVAAHTPCSIIHNFLPPEEANELLQELLLEAPTFEQMTFKLFDNVVSSPHTASFYVQSLEELEKQKTEYIYNGGTLSDVRQLTPLMRRIAPKVQAAVNASIQTRIQTHYPNGQKLNHQSPHPWRPNAAFVNCYDGPAQNVGYHSDQLTYLGPRAIIGSISLGVAREFRVKKIVPQDEDSGTASGTEGPQSKSKSHISREDDSTPSPSDGGGPISIHLPHNSLLIMHAEMQETWKHSIAPAASITPHPIAGNKRINITYRDYKAYMHPKYTPKCACNVPAVLRVVQKKRENYGRYFWMCYAGNVPDGTKEACRFFRWAEFDGDGLPEWAKGERQEIREEMWEEKKDENGKGQESGEVKE